LNHEDDTSLDPQGLPRSVNVPLSEKEPLFLKPITKNPLTNDFQSQTLCICPKSFEGFQGELFQKFPLAHPRASLASPNLTAFSSAKRGIIFYVMEYVGLSPKNHATFTVFFMEKHLYS
jgi:hypothetical protein